MRAWFLWGQEIVVPSGTRDRDSFRDNRQKFLQGQERYVPMKTRDRDYFGI